MESIELFAGAGGLGMGVSRAGFTPRAVIEWDRWCAAVVDHFSDAIVKNPIVGQTSENPRLREWHTKNLDRLPGLKFMRTLWVCDVSGGPFKFTATKPGTTPLGLEQAHRDLRISPAEFDEVAAELGRTLAFLKVPKPETDEVLAAFAAHKGEVTAGYVAKGG
ncbi:Cytosine-specific methyltransferase (fragment) [Mesorhizobium metallidurans STM 2683]|uniref:Cytosine-specific methyltransferase n=1 Tax=Mesorhizobium metallidurans STM 2683 TaxID=1297569 RepID=M5ET57_9HYPH